MSDEHSPDAVAAHHGQVPNRSYYYHQSATDAAEHAVRRTGQVGLSEAYRQAQLAEARVALEAAFGEPWDPTQNPGDAQAHAQDKARKASMAGLELAEQNAREAVELASDALADCPKPAWPWVKVVWGLSGTVLGGCFAFGLVPLGLQALVAPWGGIVAGVSAAVAGAVLAGGNLWLGRHVVEPEELRLRNAGQAALLAVAPAIALLLFPGSWRHAVALALLVVTVMAFLVLYGRALPQRYARAREHHVARERAEDRLTKREQELTRRAAEVAQCKLAIEAHADHLVERDKEAMAKAKSARLMEAAVDAGLKKGECVNRADRKAAWMAPVSKRA